MDDLGVPIYGNPHVVKVGKCPVVWCSSFFFGVLCLYVFVYCLCIVVGQVFVGLFWRFFSLILHCISFPSQSGHPAMPRVNRN